METENPASAKLPTILLATRNRHKTREIQTMLGEGAIVTDATQTPGLPEIEETGNTFVENSLHASGIVLADDSGLEVDALGGEPGVYSARYAGAGCSDEENTARVLEKMAGIPHEKRTARFRCVLAVAAEGVTLAVFDGVVEGILADGIRGSGGFGYDPIFMPIGYSETFGELSSGIKHTMSHRSRALAGFLAWWRERGISV